MAKLTENCINRLNKAVPLENILTPSPKHRGEFNCIRCGSDHHVKIFKDNNVARCAKCGESFNAIDVIMNTTGADFLDVCKEISQNYNIPLEYDPLTEEGNHDPLKNPKKEEAEAAAEDRKRKREKLEEEMARVNSHEPVTMAKADPEPPKDAPEVINLDNTPGKYEKPLKEAAESVEEAREYLHSRGLSDKTINAFKIGYIGKIYFPAAGQYLPAAVFPYNMQYSYYSARALTGKYFYKPPEKEAGREPIYNPAALEKNRPCFVCEGILDALAIIEAGGNAAALCGTAFENNLLSFLEDKRPAAPLILSLDNDKPDKDGKNHGQLIQKALSGKLDALKIPYICARYTLTEYNPEDKDPNDYLRSNRRQLEQDVKTNEAAASDNTGIDSFLYTINGNKYEPIPTGLKQIDKLLQGGLIPQTLILIGGAPGTGKTILASMIFESMARAGKKCLYINYEMAKEQLFARSISRRAADIANNYKLTALDVLQSYKLSDTAREIIQDAAGWYKREIAGNLTYNPYTDTNVDHLIEYLEETAQEAEKNGDPVPVVCIDYLHLLTGDPGEDPAGILKRALLDLKQFAIKYNTVVIAIMAQNREANKKKSASLEAGRDTSNLEYSADVVFQLVKKNPDTAPQEISVCVTKSRFTETNERGIVYELDGAISKLTPA